MNGIWGRENSLAKAYWENGTAGCPGYDMHGHMGRHNAIYFNCCEPADMAEYLRKCGITRLVFSHHEALFGSLRNAEVCEICRRFPDVYRMYVSINPNFPDRIREDLSLFDQWAPYAVGLKCLPDYHGVALNDERYRYALDFAEERGLPVLCHTWGGSGCDGGEVMLRAAERYHRLKLLLGHCIYGEFETAVRCVREFAGNVYLELTAIPGERNTIEKLVADAGSEKILYGTDMPWFDEYMAIGGVLSAKITEDDMRNILYRNAQTILGEN